MMEKNKFIIIPVCLLIFFSSCSRGTQEKQPAVAPSKKVVEEKKQVEPEKAVQVEKKEYAYVPEGKRDPFKPFISQQPVAKARELPLTPLQRYDISQLKVVGIMWGEKGRYALIEDAEGKGYVVYPGTLVGKNGGKVVKILQDEVIIEERYTDVFGETKTHYISIGLPKEEGGIK